MKKAYAIYDCRYIHNPERSLVCEVCDTLKEAKRNQYEYGDDAVIVEWEYEIEPEGSRLITKETIIR